MKLEDVLPIAQRVKATLEPYCERIEIAGSVRRRKAEVKDLEIVAIPKVMKTGLFDSVMERHPGFCKAVEQWPAIKGKPTGKYTQRTLPEGLVLDLFMAEANNWGLILAIRTGSADYSHRVLAGGWVRHGLKSAEGHLYRGDELLVVKEEEDLFRLSGVKWVEPELRTWGGK